MYKLINSNILALTNFTLPKIKVFTLRFLGFKNPTQRQPVRGKPKQAIPETKARETKASKMCP